jgi:uncharacterized protein (TIGR01627 family)
MNYKELVNKFGKGLMSKAQYKEISKELSTLCPCNVLVFGLGNDSYLWNEINKGGLTIFLEDDSTWISKFLNSNLKIHLIKYNTRVEDHQSIKFEESKIKIEIPKEIKNKAWDFIIVDAPLGHQPPRPYKGPGRMSSIFSAFNLLKKGGTVIVDDYGREIEKTYADHYFGKENLYKIVEKKVAFFKKIK